MKKHIMTLFLLFALASHAAAAMTGDVDKVDGLLKKCNKSYAKVSDYTGKFHKKELVRGKVIEQRNIFFKFMKPANFYMKWTEGKGEGAEVIFVKGENDDELLVHLGGFFSFIDLAIDPKGSLAMKHNRHTIYDAGIGRLIEIIDEDFKRAVKLDAGEFTLLKEELITERETIAVKAVFPKDKGFYANTIKINVDKQLLLPIKISIYDWDNVLIERYQYEELRINPGLTKEDFSKDNKEYGF